VIGVQVQGCDPFVTGRVPSETIMTLADGIAVKHPGKVTKPLIDEWVDDIVSVEEDHVADAMVMLMERSKLLVEGGGAVGLSALLADRVAPAKSGVTCIVLSGGNVDIGNIPNLVRRHETTQGRRLMLSLPLPDRPGALADLLHICANLGANVIELQHTREGVQLHARETMVTLILETRGQDHAVEINQAIKALNHVV
jgi:threonine dehydratase